MSFVKMQESQWRDKDYQGEEKDSDDEFVPPVEPPLKKVKSLESTFLTFTEEDLLFYVQRVSVDMKDLVKKTLQSEEGKVMGVLIKLLDSRMAALSRRLCGMHKGLKEENEVLKSEMKELQTQMDKAQGMMKFCYAWCKKASDAGVFVLPRGY